MLLRNKPYVTDCIQYFYSKYIFVWSLSIQCSTFTYIRVGVDWVTKVTWCESGNTHQQILFLHLHRTFKTKFINLGHSRHDNTSKIKPLLSARAAAAGVTIVFKLSLHTHTHTHKRSPKNN